jgi:MFS family permease
MTLTNPSSPRRTLAAACGAHALHDGFTDLIYVLLPIWQTEFGLAYSVLAMLRGLYAGMTAGAQIPAGRMAERFGIRPILALGTALVAAGYALAGASGGLACLLAALLLSGLGASTQHPLASAAVSRVYGGGQAARGPLGTYNFAGDVGKAVIPAITALALTVLPWRYVAFFLAVFALLCAPALFWALPTVVRQPPSAGAAKTGGGKGGFWLLLLIGILDSGVRMGLLTFLPFLLTAKGGGEATIGLALALVFLGGGAGKLVCGWFASRFGIVGTVLLTEMATALGVLALIDLPLQPALILLPVLGVALNGTSSVLYGSVAELAPAERTERAFATFYSGTIGSGALSPVIYGAIGDVYGVPWATAATAAAALMTVPLALILAPRFRTDEKPVTAER